MQLVHRPESGGGSQVLASDIEIADSFLAQARGLMFRRSLAEDSALVFQFDSAAKRDVHMLFVPFAIDALWLVDNEVVAKKRLKPWIGLGRETAETLVELPAGAADDVAVGDRVTLE
ncbi:DUF192 domain-containing protein [Halonotius aquaticus]|uniref:DUF192 domain-containing protein n=1 Tax=Halonotius aquaticus TaxID=2216978 RepID=A0A3A6PR54_9EURY|nr:DUF192 domain-containing protein [Halonotius aquaticus]RJX44163.1 DUF192 domain-containing protein [Halonotius aquaticus]